jgi:hypothetical protein
MLNSSARDQLQSQHEYKTATTTSNTRTKGRSMKKENNQLTFFKFKHVSKNIVELQIAKAAEAYLAKAR